jgi:hypothetical protein
MAVCCAEGCITNIRDARMEEKSGKYGRMEATFQEGQGPERSVVPWMDGWMDRGLTMIYYIPKSLFFFSDLANVDLQVKNYVAEADSASAFTCG